MSYTGEALDTLTYHQKLMQFLAQRILVQDHLFFDNEVLFLIFRLNAIFAGFNGITGFNGKT